MRASGRFAHCVTILLTVGACSGPKPAPKRAPTPAAPSAQAAPKRVDVKALLARELEPQANHQVAAADGSFTATMEASRAPQLTPREGSIRIVAPLGESPLTCFVYPQVKDAGDLVRQVVADTLDKAAPNNRWVDVRADQVAGWGYVMARANYEVDGPKGKLVGDFKIAASVRDQTSVVCHFGAPGLYATFERALRVFLGSLDVAAIRNRAKPVESSITRAQEPGRAVTLSRSDSTLQGKSLVSLTFSTTLSISPEGKLVTSDQAAAETFARGRLETGSYASFSGGTMDYKLDLERHHRKYRISGSAQGNPVTGEFMVEGGIMDSERANAEVCKVRDGKETQVALVVYRPDIDPLNATTRLVTKSTTPDGDVVVKVEGAKPADTSVRLDEGCDMQSGTLKAGTATMALERLWHEKPAT
jgi:hypothetical protein